MDKKKERTNRQKQNEKVSLSLEKLIVTISKWNFWDAKQEQKDINKTSFFIQNQIISLAESVIFNPLICIKLKKNSRACKGF